MTLDRSWLDDLEGVDALAILTDADLLSHENGHALFFDGLEPLLDQCILISADPQYLLQNLKHVTSSSEFLSKFQGPADSKTYLWSYLSHITSLRHLIRSNYRSSYIERSSRNPRFGHMHHSSHIREETK